VNIKITALILTKNEEIHIRRCIESISKISDEIVVLDSYSDDKTAEICRTLNVKFHVNSWVNYAQQFNHGVSLASNEWILRIDADEYLDSNLLSQLEEIKKGLFSEKVKGFYFNRFMFFLGQPIKFGGLFPAKIIRLFHKKFGHIEQRWMDEHIVLNGESQVLKGKLIDDNLNSISWWIDKHNSYASREAADFLNSYYDVTETESTGSLSLKQDKIKRFIKERIYYRLHPSMRVRLYFTYRMIIRLGFLDRSRGRQFHFFQGYWYRTLVDCKIQDAHRKIKNGLEPNLAIEELLKNK
jgi:glycosyltransferase involved in cell wall biosynthesis